MSRVLVITGMHRSGTSLVASLFARAGVHLGAQLLEAQADNPFGFFEDVDFVEFHENALHARGQNILVTRDFQFTPTPEEEARASGLLAARGGRALWGWKDPRTCLFLDFWHARLPDAQFLMVYRHPLDVILSLARRGEVVGFDFFNALDAWQAHNAPLLEFARQHPDAVRVCDSYAAVTQIETFKTTVERAFSLTLHLDAETRDAVFHAGHLRRAPRSPGSEALLRRIHPDTMALYDALQAQAFLPDTEPVAGESAEIAALCEFGAQLPAPLPEAHRRALLGMLIALTDPALYETFARDHPARTNELETQRRAWQTTAQDRAQIIRAQTEWAEPRMKDLEKLEASPLVRALRRLGLIDRS